MERKRRKKRNKRKKMSGGEIKADIFDSDFWDTPYRR